MDWIVSVGWTGRVNDWGGFSDLNVRVTEAAVFQCYSVFGL
jgi:hypothetical protein